MRSSAEWGRGLRTKFSAEVLPIALVILVGCLLTRGGHAFEWVADEDDFSTPEEARALQERIIKLIEETHLAVVGVEILIRDDDGLMMGIAGGSGTIIDAEEGLILTAGHVGRTNGLPVHVYLHDGTMLRGETAGQHLDGQEDCGLIKIDADELEEIGEENKLHEIPIGDSTSVHAGDWVLVFGHALGIEKQPWRPAPVRVGRITGNHGHVLTMDAPLNSGDSGGPMIDLDGQLIGINESCSMHPFENAATAINIATERLEGMIAGECTGVTLPHAKEGLDLIRSENSTRPVIFQRADPFGGRHAEDVRGAFADAVWDAADWTIRVYMDGEQLGFGLIVDESGLLVTKASELDPREEQILVATPAGLLEDAKILARDPKLDLLLLQLPPGEWIPVPFEQASTPSVGAWVVSAGPDATPISFGIRGLDTYVSDLSVLDRAFLGVRIDRPARGQLGARVVDVVAGSAARRAGLVPDDVIMKIEGKEIRGPNGLVGTLADHRPDEVITIEFMRDGQPRSAAVRLGSRLMSDVEYESGNIVVPVNRRDTGFGNVIQHDSLVEADECGSPLVDLDGRFVGMNIARSDRTKTFAIPADVLQESVARMKSQLDGGKAWLAIDPMELQVPIADKKDGSFKLDAMDAQVFGPSAGYDRLAKGGHIGHWLSDRDEVLWVIESPGAGSYEVWLDLACDVDAAGVKFAVRSDRDVLETTVDATGGWDRFEKIMVGEIEIGAAESTIISIKPINDPPLALMNLRSVELTPIFD